MIESLSNLGDNPYFGAGFGLLGVGAGLTAARRALNYGLIFIRRRYVMTNEITHRDPSYSWMLNWLNHHQKNVLQVNQITQYHQRASGKFNSHIDFVPSVGVHYLKFQNKWMKVDRERQQGATDLTMGSPFETLKFTCIGTKKDIFSAMAAEARDLEASRHHGKMVVYEPRTSSWEPFGEPKSIRDFSTVVLEDGLAEGILRNINEFLNSKEYYTKRGMPYRINYLLHGPPGSGKTTFVHALAGAIGYDVCALNIGNSTLSDERANYLINKLPPASVLLLEDIDAAFLNRGDFDTDKPAYLGLGKLTMTGILNAIDGIMSCEDRIVFMTTNFPKRLDAAMMRPGRVDHEAYFGHASDTQLARAFELFHPREPDKPTGECFVKAIYETRERPELLKDTKIEEWLKNNTKLELSMAEVHYYLMYHRDKPEEALKNVDRLIVDSIVKKLRTR